MPNNGRDDTLTVFIFSFQDHYSLGHAGQSHLSLDSLENRHTGIVWLRRKPFISAFHFSSLFYGFRHLHIQKWARVVLDIWDKAFYFVYCFQHGMLTYLWKCHSALFHVSDFAYFITLCLPCLPNFLFAFTQYWICWWIIKWWPCPFDLMLVEAWFFCFYVRHSVICTDSHSGLTRYNMVISEQYLWK